MADFQTLGGLTQLNKVPLDMTLDGLAAVNQMQRGDSIGLQELMRKQAYEQSMDPLRVQHQALQNTGLDLGNQAAGFNLSSLGRKDKMEAELWDQTKASQLQKLLASEGEDKAKAFTSGIYEKLRTTQPGTREHRALMGALQTTQDWMEKERDQRYRMAQTGATIQGQKDVMKMQIDAGRFKKADKYGASFEQRLGTFKKAHEQHQALVQAELMARQEGNEPLADSYKARADAIRPQAEAELRMLAQAGKIDLSKLRPDNPIPTVPQGSIAPGASAPTSGKTKSGVSYQVVTD